MLNFQPILSTMFKVALPIATISNMGLYTLFLKTNTNTLVDFGWGLNQWLIGGYLFLNNINAVNAISFAILTAWTARLSGTLYINRVAKGENDPRYEKMAKKSIIGNRNLYFLFQFALQGVLVTIPAIPLYYMFTASSAFTLTHAFGSVIALSGIGLSALADNQLNDYKRSQGEHSDKPKQLFRGGLWAKSRHPNLFYEIVTWSGFALMGMNNLSALPAFIGPLSLWAIMHFLTIPLTEAHMKKSRSNWNELIKGTNTLLPF